MEEKPFSRQDATPFEGRRCAVPLFSTSAFYSEKNLAFACFILYLSSFTIPQSRFPIPE